MAVCGAHRWGQYIGNGVRYVSPEVGQKTASGSIVFPYFWERCIRSRVRWGLSILWAGWKTGSPLSSPIQWCPHPRLYTSLSHTLGMYISFSIKFSRNDKMDRLDFSYRETIWCFTRCFSTQISGWCSVLLASDTDTHFLCHQHLRKVSDGEWVTEALAPACPRRLSSSKSWQHPRWKCCKKQRSRGWWQGKSQLSGRSLHCCSSPHSVTVISHKESCALQ